MKNFLIFSKKFGFLFLIAAVICAVLGALIHPAFFTGASLAIAPFASLSREELELLAMSKLSDNFGGSPYENNAGDPYESFNGIDEDDLYDGSEDDTLSFIGSGKSFRDEIDGGVEVSYSISNNTASRISVALANGSVSNATVLKNNFGADCYLTDGVMKSINGRDVVGTGIGTIAGIDGFVDFSLRNAFRVTKMVIQAVNNADQSVNTVAYNKVLTIRRFSPFRLFGEERINLYKYYLTSQQNKEKIEVNLNEYNIQRDDQTVMVMDIDPGVTITITETIGAIQNSAATLYKKAVKAKENVSKGTAGLTSLREFRVTKGVAKKAPMSKIPQGRIAEIMAKLRK